MNRIEIKNKAKEMISGHLWDLILPFLIAGFLSAGVYAIIAGNNTNESYLSTVSFLVSAALYPVQLGCVAYVLNFVRKQPYDLKMIFGFYKKFFFIFALYFLISLFTALWTMLLIIPGFIAALSYSMSQYIMLDGEADPMECIRKSKAMMNGYKWDYFKFILSFIGWYLLIIPTLGLILIYVGPYVMVSQTLYYEELKKIS